MLNNLACSQILTSKYILVTLIYNFDVKYLNVPIFFLGFFFKENKNCVQKKSRICVHLWVGRMGYIDHTATTATKRHSQRGCRGRGEA